MLTDPRADLHTVRRLWPALRQMLTVPPADTWPPRESRTFVLVGLDDHAAQAAADARAERAERTAVALGERPAPLRPPVLDTITAVETLLLETADQVGHWQPADLTDAERWHWAASWRHGATWACTYLGAALGWLPAVPRGHVQAAAAGARRTVETALGLAERTDPIRGRRCPGCSGEQLVMRQGGERTPEVYCRTCPARWVGADMAALLTEPAA